MGTLDNFECFLAAGDDIDDGRIVLDTRGADR